MTPSYPQASSATDAPRRPLVFFGTEDFSLASLQALIDGGFHVAAVVTKPDTARGRRRSLTPPAVKLLAQQHGIQVLQPNQLDDAFIGQLIGVVSDGSPTSEAHPQTSRDTSDHGADEDSARRSTAAGAPLTGVPPIAGVLVSYGKIIPQKVLDLFTPGIINVHPSLLPKYRGPSPIEAAILHGDTETGVTLMKLVKDMDAGPIYIQTTHPLLGTETKPDLYDLLGRLGAELLVTHLPAIVNGELPPAEQDDTAASYCSLLTKKDSQLLPEHKNAEMLEREIRAYQGFPKSRLTLFGHDVIITRARVAADEHDGDIVLPCADGTYLAVEHLIAPSGRRMSAAEFVRGYKK